MKLLRNLVSHPALVACIAAFGCGCTTTVRTSPDSLKLEPGAVSHLPARNVTLVNGHTSEMVGDARFVAYMKR